MAAELGKTMAELSKIVGANRDHLCLNPKQMA
jgi:hypothetical protein